VLEGAFSYQSRRTHGADLGQCNAMKGEAPITERVCVCLVLARPSITDFA
jgi:hypothetical protein